MSIIGLEITKTKIRLAYDTQTTTGDDKRVENENHKGLRINNIIIGVTGNSLTKIYLAEFLKKKNNVKLESCYCVCELMQEFFQNYQNNNRVTDLEHLGSVLITDGLKAFCIDLRYFSCEEILEYGFAGSGSAFAEGAYLMQKKLIQKHENFDSLVESLKIACKKDVFCGEPIKVIEIEKANLKTGDFLE